MRRDWLLRSVVRDLFRGHDTYATNLRVEGLLRAVRREAERTWTEDNGPTIDEWMRNRLSLALARPPDPVPPRDPTSPLFFWGTVPDAAEGSAPFSAEETGGWSPQSRRLAEWVNRQQRWLTSDIGLIVDLQRRVTELERPWPRRLWRAWRRALKTVREGP